MQRIHVIVHKSHASIFIEIHFIVVKILNLLIGKLVNIYILQVLLREFYTSEYVIYIALQRHNAIIGNNDPIDMS